MVKIISCSHRGPGPCSQRCHGSPQPSVTSWRRSSASWILHGQLHSHTQSHMHTCVTSSHSQKVIKFHGSLENNVRFSLSPRSQSFVFLSGWGSLILSRSVGEPLCVTVIVPSVSRAVAPHDVCPLLSAAAYA